MLARIVVIEDDVYMREELIDMLKKAGYGKCLLCLPECMGFV